MKTFVAGALVAAAQATDLKLAWSDCGDADTHTKITSFTPATLTLGQKTTMAGSGTIDEDVSDATFDLEMTGALGKLLSCTGPATVSKTCNLPLGTGTLTFEAMSFPIKAGPSVVKVDIQLGASLPSALAKTTTITKSTATNGDKLFCMKIDSSPATDYEAMWGDFKNQYGKFYNGVDEEAKRFGIFQSNVDFINESNAKKLSYTLGVNQFSDLTADEFAATYTGLKKPKDLWGDLPYLGKHSYSGKALPSAVDWSTKGAVTPVKNQGSCGSCWAFSTTGALEGAWEITTGTTVSLSEQQFVDCDHNGDQGCNGGLMDNAFGYAEKNAICTEQSYSYTGRGGSCRASSCTVGIPKGGVTGFKDVATDNEQALMEAVAQQPVSIAIEADKSAFQQYSGGVLSSTCGTNLDHGVLAVGYGTDNGNDYWKVKNSWGTSFGEAGYIRLLRGKRGAGECGLLSGPPSYPVVSGTSGKNIVV